MSDALKAGDVVMLRSGGPSMTITAVGDRYGTESAWCSWFDGKKEASGVFPLPTLRLEEAGPG